MALQVDEAVQSIDLRSGVASKPFPVGGQARSITMTPDGNVAVAQGLSWSIVTIGIDGGTARVLRHEKLATDVVDSVIKRAYPDLVVLERDAVAVAYLGKRRLVLARVMTNGFELGAILDPARREAHVLRGPPEAVLNVGGQLVIALGETGIAFFDGASVDHTSLGAPGAFGLLRLRDEILAVGGGTAGGAVTRVRLRDRSIVGGGDVACAWPAKLASWRGDLLVSCGGTVANGGELLLLAPDLTTQRTLRLRAWNAKDIVVTGDVAWVTSYDHKLILEVDLKRFEVTGGIKTGLHPETPILVRG